jgi:hypothetical protein
MFRAPIKYPLDELYGHTRIIIAVIIFWTIQLSPLWRISVQCEKRIVIAVAYLGPGQSFDRIDVRYTIDVIIIY